MSSFMKKLASGAGAYGYAQLVTISTQLVSLPIFLHYWSSKVYGEWLMLSAIPVYFAMSDFGMVSTAANRMTSSLAKGEAGLANITFQTAIVGVSLTLVAMGLTSAIVMPCLNLDLLREEGYLVALLLLVFAALLAVASSLFEALFRAHGEYARGTLLITTGRLAEWVAAVFALLIFRSILATAVGYFLGRLVMMAFMLIYSKRRFPDIRWGVEKFSKAELLEMLRPALAFMALPLSSAFCLQGLTLIIGAFLGPATVAIFNTYRTLSRVIVQMALAVSRPLWPELSRFSALGQTDKIRKVFWVGTAGMTAISVATAVAMHYAAPLILQSWTHGKIPFLSASFTLFLIAACISSAYQISFVTLAATDSHVSFAVFSVSLSTLGLVCSYLLVPEGGFDAANWIQIATEAATLFASIYLTIQKLNPKLVVSKCA